MKYETIQDLKDTDFKRLTGAQRETFEEMLKKVEDALVRSKKFRLPGKKVLQPSDTVFEVILVERPKKARKGTTAAKRSATLKKRN